MMPTRRPGFSLLEVMLATTVLLGSVIVLSHISFVGTAHMDAAQQYAAAQLVCQARMNEMLAGALPIEEVSHEAIAELPGWGLTVKVRSAGHAGLLAIEVTAAEQPAESAPGHPGVPAGNAAGETVTTDVSPQQPTGSPQPTLATTGSRQQAVGAGKRFTLVRWIAEGKDSESTSFRPASQLAIPVDVPQEPSLFDDTLPPGDGLPSEEPIPAGGSFQPDDSPPPFGLPPEGPPLPEGLPPPDGFPPPEGPDMSWSRWHDRHDCEYPCPWETLTFCQHFLEPVA